MGWVGGWGGMGMRRDSYFRNQDREVFGGLELGWETHRALRAKGLDGHRGWVLSVVTTLVLYGSFILVRQSAEMNGRCFFRVCC